MGHEETLSRLEPVSKSAGGAYLFSGPPSVGKRSTAFALSKILMCQEGVGSDCKCPSCAAFKMDHPDFLCVGSSAKIKVADIDNILSFATTVAFLGRKKIVVLDNAHDITWEAANRLLKTLEEPPAGMTFFLISHEPALLLPTILSRCVRYEFGSLLAEDITNILWKTLGFDLPKARVLGWIAGTSPVDVFAKAGPILKYRDMAVDLMTTCKGRKPVDFMDFVDKVDRADLPLFIDMLVLVLTDMLLLAGGGEPKTTTNVDVWESLSKAAMGMKLNALVYTAVAVGQTKRNAYLNVNLNMALKAVLVRAAGALSS